MLAKQLAVSQNSEAYLMEQIRELIRSYALQEATDKDVARVSAHLAAGGWPLADPDVP